MQIKDKTGSNAARGKAALESEIGAKTDSNHILTSIDAHAKEALKEWCEDKNLVTGLLLSLNKNRLASRTLTHTHAHTHTHRSGVVSTT